MDDGQATHPITWLGSSRANVKRFPQQVRRDMGNALYAAQRGEVDLIRRRLADAERRHRQRTH
ncbi:MAG: hypothetical protein MUE61_17755 [Vicinamibacterales bacterium]|jgi:phage-related protein|nr:hypothetical protein [Vicinamibacterales bacterium]